MRMTDREAVAWDMPWWYGVANRDPLTRSATVYPIPFNKVANWSLRLWTWLRYAIDDDERAQAYAAGEQAAAVYWCERYERHDRELRERAFDLGYTAGREATLDALRERHATDDEFTAWYVARHAADVAAHLGGV